MAEAIKIIRILTQEDFDRFAAISGDDNPIHVDTTFAEKTRFGTTVAHGMFLYSILEGLGTKLAGEAVIRQTALMFPAPARVGDEIEFQARQVTESSLHLAARRIADGETVCLLTLELERQS